MGRVLERATERVRTQAIPTARHDARGCIIQSHDRATARLELSNLTIERVTAEVHDAADEIVADRGLIESRVGGGKRPDLFDLRREGNELANARPVEWLYTKAIANGMECSVTPRIEHQKREHSVEVFGAPRTPLDPRGQENFGVGVGNELVPHLRELAAKLHMVVDLAVVHDR